MSDMQLDPYVVGSAISRARRKRGLTQEVLSGLSNIGRTHLSAIERGERKPSLETIWRIAAAMDIPPSDLVKEIETEMRKSRD